MIHNDLFCPALAAQAGEAGQRLVSDALQDHQRIKELLADVQEIEDDTAFEARFCELREHVERHVEAEERVMLPQAARALAAHLVDLIALMQERKAQMLAS